MSKIIKTTTLTSARLATLNEGHDRLDELAAYKVLSKWIEINMPPLEKEIKGDIKEMAIEEASGTKKKPNNRTLNGTNSTVSIEYRKRARNIPVPKEVANLMIQAGIELTLESKEKGRFVLNPELSATMVESIKDVLRTDLRTSYFVDQILIWEEDKEYIVTDDTIQSAFKILPQNLLTDWFDYLITITMGRYAIDNEQLSGASISQKLLKAAHRIFNGKSNI